MSERFKPNDLKESDIESLEPWQAVVAACHFGPTMGDCVELEYEYTMENGTIYCHDGRDKIDLDGDIDMINPIDSLMRYAGLKDINEVAKYLLKNNLASND